MITASFTKDFAGWRAVAREFVGRGVPPSEILWDSETPSLFGTEELPPLKPGSAFSVPKEFLALSELVSYARTEERWALLYRLLYRLRFETPDLLSFAVDADVLKAQALAKSVRRDIHKMHAFVRFKEERADGQQIYVAWHQPEHLILRPAAEFFVRRFGDKPWSIFTPDESAHWNLSALTFGPGLERSRFQVRDEWDEIWKTYYKSIFNPARIKIKAMKQEMAPKYWSSLPEAPLISELLREAPARLQRMASEHRESARVDPTRTLPELRSDAQRCRACPLHARATHTVFGEGPLEAKLMIIGEQPGDQEDLAGRAFVGPAGQLLDEALREAGIARETVYVTNAVKHFKWEERGKTRLHKKPSGSEVNACKPWLEAEIAHVKPKVILALGATAATAIIGRLPRLTEERGRALTHLGAAPSVILSWHPAAILRATSESDRLAKRDELRKDLALAHRLSLS